MNFITWTSTGAKLYLGEDVFSVTYDQLTLYIIIVGICAGLIIGLIASYFTRIASHQLLLALTGAGCSSPETALTLDQLSLRSQGKFKRMLKHSKPMRRNILCANEDEMPVKPASKLKKFWFKGILSRDIPQKTDFSIAKFYIPRDKLESVSKRYSREGMSPIALIITIVVLLGVAVAALFVVPELLKMADNVFGSSDK